MLEYISIFINLNRYLLYYTSNKQILFDSERREGDLNPRVQRTPT